ncbi:MAG: type I-E CRISPR-associated protein Cas5/CasD [Bacilli bacterium]|jgi:CRISPR system Cascade subunit CasD
MVTLLLRLAGPLQSWGVGSKFETRTTSKAPSKSGVLGMVASAMGRDREDSLDDLASLKFGVRIDQEGTILKDFHTAHSASRKTAYVTNRHYLENGCFLVGLEGDETLLFRIEDAIKNPFYPLYLGRRSCPPTGRMILGFRDKVLYEALRDEPWLASEWYRKRTPSNVMLEIVCEDDSDLFSESVRDVPLSFSQTRRKHGFRNVRRVLDGKTIENSDSGIKKPMNAQFDPMFEVKKEVR